MEMKILMLALSVLVVCLAHLMRMYRWKLFVRIYEKPADKALLQALTIGYFINFFVPFKLGDLIRAWYSGRKMKNGKSFSFATVIVDRCLDVLVVGFIFTFFSLAGINKDKKTETTLFYIVIAIAMLLTMLLVYGCRGSIKKVLKTIAGIFNDDIETRILRFFWSVIWSFKDIFLKIHKLKLIGSTLCMWALYILSYYFFAESVMLSGCNYNWIDVFNLLFAQNSFEVGSIGVTHVSKELLTSFPLMITVYLMAPLLILFIITVFMKIKTVENLTENEESKAIYLNLLPQLDKEERLKFLELYFSNERREYLGYYLKINQNIQIISDYSAGSNATTMLCMDTNGTFFRKYAFGKDSDKLYQQIEWIQKHNSELPLPQILRYQKQDEYCFYDMPYQSNAVGLFHYAHSMPKERAWNMIKNAANALEHSIYCNHIAKANYDSIKKYVTDKVDKNLTKIVESKYIKPLLDYKEIYINGVPYKNILFYKKFLSLEHLTEVFKNDVYADIHGDLTIENIICTREQDGRDSFYIIDPNTGNIHDSPNLDYAKILQSIHGGYEFLMATKKVETEHNHINFMFTKSAAYIYLHKQLKEHMLENFSIERVKSIYYHEIIHWLRLMPYKIEKDGKRCLLFYAGTLLVLNDVIKMFEE